MSVQGGQARWRGADIAEPSARPHRHCLAARAPLTPFTAGEPPPARGSQRVPRSPRPGAHPPNGPPPGHALQEGHREQGLVGGPGAGSGELVARVWVPGEALRVQARLCGFQRLLHLLAGMSAAPPRLRPCGLDSHRSGSTSLLPRDPCMRASRPGGSLALPQGGHVLFHLTTWAARPAVFQPL